MALAPEPLPGHEQAWRMLPPDGPGPPAWLPTNLRLRTGRGMRPPGEALDGQALASLFRRQAVRPWVDTLFDSIPVGFCDSKLIEEVTCRTHRSGGKWRGLPPSCGQGTVGTESLKGKKSHLGRACHG